MVEVGVAPEELEVIALTHVHLDHAGGAGHLVEACPNATVYVHDIGAPHLVDPERLWEGTKQAVGDQIQYYTEPRPVPDHRIAELEEGDEIDLGDHTLEVAHAPGHAPHQVVFHDPAIDGVFTADAAGIFTPSTDAVNVTSPPVNFDLDQALADIETIRDLDPETLLYAHYGPGEQGAAVEELQRYREMLPAYVEQIDTLRERHGRDVEAIAAEMEAEWGHWSLTTDVAGVLRYLGQSSG